MIYETRKTFDCLTARVEGTTLTFKYTLENPQTYERFNSFIQGMEWKRATATISTATNVALNIDDKVVLENGQTLRIASISAPKVDKRKSLMSKTTVSRRLIYLE